MDFCSLITFLNKGHIEVAKCLIGNGATVDVKTNGSFTPLYIASQEGQTEVAKFLIENGGATIDAKDNEGCTPLYIASQNGHNEVAKLLIENGATIDAKDNEG